jgi:hypothetical protein
MATSVEFFQNEHDIVLPPAEGPLDARGLGQLISLRGPTSCIEMDSTWHIEMIVSLRRLGYKGKIYVPYRVGEHMFDDEKFTQKAKEQDRRAFEASAVQIFFQPENEQLDVKILIPFVVEAERSSRVGKTSYVIGADKPSALGLDSDQHFKVHEGPQATAYAAYDSLFPLKPR